MTESGAPPTSPAATTRARPKWPWYLLLLPPYVANLWVASYDRVEPTLGGMPFFYWYQFLWVVIAALLTGVVYRMTVDRDP